MEKQRKGLSWQITLYIGVVVSFLMGFFLLVDYFSQQELVLYYRAEIQKGSVDAAVHEMAGHMLSRRTAYMAFILIAVMGATWLVVKAVVLRPLDLLFMHQYTASRGDLQKVPLLAIQNEQNEFHDLYKMFNIMINRLNEYRDESIADARRVELTCRQLQESLSLITRYADTILATNRLDATLTEHLSGG